MPLISRIIYFIAILIVGLIPLEALTIADGVTYSRYLYIFLLGLSLFNFRLLIPSNKRYIQILGLFLLYAFFSLFWSKFIDETFLRVLLLIQYFLLVIILENSVKTKQQILGLLVAFIFGCLFISISTIFDFVQNGMQVISNKVYRVNIVGNPNENSFMIIFSIILTIIILKYWRQNIFTKVLSYLYLFIATLAIFANGSRNGFVMLLIVISTYIISSLKNFSFKNIISLSILIIVGTVFIMKYVPETTLLRFMNTGDDIQSGNLAHREVIWYNAWQMIKSIEFNSLVGSGWGTFNNEYLRYYEIYSGAHNFYITTFYTLGAIGILLLFTYLAILFKRLIKIKDKDTLILLLLLVIPMISMLTTNWESRKWWFIIGVFIYKISSIHHLEVIKYKMHENKNSIYRIFDTRRRSRKSIYKHPKFSVTY